MLTAVPSTDTAKLQQTLYPKVDSNVAPNEIQKKKQNVPIRVVEGGRGWSIWKNHNPTVQYFAPKHEITYGAKLMDPEKDHTTPRDIIWNTGERNIFT